MNCQFRKLNLICPILEIYFSRNSITQGCKGVNSNSAGVRECNSSHTGPDYFQRMTYKFGIVVRRHGVSYPLIIGLINIARRTCTIILEGKSDKRPSQVRICRCKLVTANICNFEDIQAFTCHLTTSA